MADTVVQLLDATENYWCDANAKPPKAMKEPIDG